MKKSILFLALFFSASMLFSQMTPQGGSGDNVARGPIDGPGGNYLNCPTASIFSQSPSGLDEWHMYTSDLKTDNPWRCYESFSDLSGPIKVLHFWGANAYWDFQVQKWIPCPNENPMTFEIKFWQEVHGFPVIEIASFELEVEGINTNCYYIDPSFTPPLDLGNAYYYRAVLPDFVNMSEGWVSITGISVGSPNDCQFLWLSSPDGDGTSFQWQILPPANLYQNFYDLSLCIESEVPEIPLSPWAVGIAIFMIGIIAVARRFS